MKFLRSRIGLQLCLIRYVEELLLHECLGKSARMHFVFFFFLREARSLHSQPTVSLGAP